MTNQSAVPPPDDASTAPKRKPYRRPEIVSREPLEAMAATCPPGRLTRGKANTSVCGVARS